MADEMIGDGDGEKPWDEGLRPRERAFVLELCTGIDTFLNPSAAYREVFRRKDRESGEWVYPETATCNSNSSRLMKRGRIRAALFRLLSITQGDIDEANVYRTVRQIADLAFYNPADIIDKNGRLKAESLEALGEKAKCITGIRLGKYGNEIMLADRAKYLDMLAKYLKLVRPDVQIEANLAVVEVAPKFAGDGEIDAADRWNEMAAKET